MPVTQSPPVAIQAHGLRKSFRVKDDVVEAVSGLDLTVTAGQIFGFLGPNGAGKTTTLRILTTLLPADAGEAFVAGIDVMRSPQQVRRPLWRSGGEPAVTSVRWPELRYLAGPSVRAAVTATVV